MLITETFSGFKRKLSQEFNHNTPCLLSHSPVCEFFIGRDRSNNQSCGVKHVRMKRKEIKKEKRI